MSEERPQSDEVTLRLSCGCTIKVAYDATVPSWEPGEATFCDDDDHGLVDVVEVTEPWPEMNELMGRGYQRVRLLHSDEPIELIECDDLEDPPNA